MGGDSTFGSSFSELARHILTPHSYEADQCRPHPSLVAEAIEADFARPMFLAGTLGIAKAAHTGLSSYSAKSIYAFVFNGETIPDAHREDADVCALRKMFKFDAASVQFSRTQILSNLPVYVHAIQFTSHSLRIPLTLYTMRTTSN